MGTQHKKIRRLFIDNKISEKDRQKAIIGEQDGQIIFLYVAGRLYLKKRPIIQNIKVANKIRETTSSIGVNHLVRRDLPIGTLNVFFDAT